MQELRLVGVHEDGAHLLLSGDGGTTFRLPINEALRSASSRPSTRVPPAAASATPGQQSSPRDVQARIRNGANAEDLARELGLDLAYVQRYEGPVRAERDYIAHLAQQVAVAAALPSHDGYRSAFGDHPALLGEMVAFRLQAYRVDPSATEWDSWRNADGTWTVVARFSLGAEAAAAADEDPPAQWIFSPARKTLRNTNRWAQLLSELEPLDGPLPARRLTAVADRVFDFEAAAEDKDDDADSSAAADGLLDVLRSRRGQRLGLDEDGDDALAELLTKGSVPAAHPRPGAASAANDAPATDDDERELWPVEEPLPGLRLAPAYRAQDDDAQDGLHEDGSPRLFDDVSTETREISLFARPSSQGAGSGNQADSSAAGHQDRAAEPAPALPDRRLRPKRSSVPSWDEIVFGTKGD